jgi:flagellar biogenesis protein FliO
MDEGNRKKENMMSQGWQRYCAVGLVWGMFAIFAQSAFSSSLTVRDIVPEGNGKARIILDGVAPKGSINLEYVRDIVQFSIQNSTIYPAKIVHAEGAGAQAFNKIFAYQYAPNLVRVRFSVDGKADQYQGKVRVETKGKVLEISFPSPVAQAQKNDEHEKSLIAKVLGQSSAPKVEESPKTEEKPKAEEKLKAEERTKVRIGNQAKPVELGGRTRGPSVFRSLFAMFLIVGGLGLVLLYLKKKGRGTQAKRVGDSWISGFLPGGKKQKAFIEVMANHALGPKQSITVVRIRGQQFVLGVTQDSVQLITQLDSDEADLDLLDDPKVADSIGRMFGSPVKSEKTSNSAFDSILKGSAGAGAIVARNAYQNQAASNASGPSIPMTSSFSSGPGVRDQIKKRLQGMRDV